MAFYLSLWSFKEPAIVAGSLQPTDVRRISGQAAALLLGPPITIAITTALTNTAALLDVAHIGDAEAVIRYGMLACGLQAILLDGGTHLLALARIWRRLHLCVAFD